MYQPAHFKVEDHAALHALMREFPLATLVVPTPGGLEINHVPLLVDGDGDRLVGHVARANPVWQAEARGEACAVFQGPQAYVTPQWYPSKREHGKAVPTWNYAVAHVHGTLRWITADTPEGDAWLHALVSRLTDTHEAAHGAARKDRGLPATQAWQVSDAPQGYLQAMRRAIVGLELTVTRIEGKFKVSQNRPAADLEATIAGLDEVGEAGSAALARSHRPR